MSTQKVSVFYLTFHTVTTLKEGTCTFAGNHILSTYFYGKDLSNHILISKASNVFKITESRNIRDWEICNIWSEPPVLTIKSTWVQACKPKRRGLVPTKPFKHHACIFTSANSSRGHSRKSLAWSRKNPHAGTRGGVQQQLSLSGTNVSVDNGTCKPYQKTVEEKIEKVFFLKKKKAFLPVTV